METDQILLGLALVFGFYMAWNIGANDVANAMGTSVGSKAITLAKAIVIAAIFEFCGAFFVGSAVTKTVRDGMFDPALFDTDIYMLVYGMLAALMAAGVWLQIATYFGWPVSTTHSIVGAIVGFIIVAQGSSAVNWSKVGEIVASWGVSPLLSGTISYVIFVFIRQKIFFSKDPLKACKRSAPVFIFAVFLVMSLVMVYKGLKNLKLDLSFNEALLISSAIGCFASLIGSLLLRKYFYFEDSIDRKDGENTTLQEVKIMDELSRVPSLLDNFSGESDEFLKERVKKLDSEVNKLIGEIKKGALSHSQREQRAIVYKNIEKIFAKLQVVSACFIAFAHGSNDVANAIGPIAAVVTILQTHTVSSQVPVPMWVLAMGGLGIVIGLATWGYKVILTIGKKITALSPSRGFAATFGAAVTIVIASKQGYPISTTHALVGSVLGVGLAQGVNSINMKVVRNIFSSWFITLPVSGILSIIFYYILKTLFG